MYKQKFRVIQALNEPTAPTAIAVLPCAFSCPLQKKKSYKCFRQENCCAPLHVRAKFKAWSSPN